MIQRSCEPILASSVLSLSCEWAWSACMKALCCFLYISVIPAGAEERMFKACLSPRQRYPTPCPSPAMQELWLFHVAAYLCQADLLLRGTNDLHLTNQFQLLIPSDFNESTNISNPYLTNTGLAEEKI